MYIEPVKATSLITLCPYAEQHRSVVHGLGVRHNEHEQYDNPINEREHDKSRDARKPVFGVADQV